MIYAFILSFLAALALSYSEIRKIFLILYAAPVKDGVFPSDVIEKCNGAVEGNAIKTPLGQVECALWQVKVDVRRGGSYLNKRMIFEDSSIAPFFIRTGKELVHIRPMNANLPLDDENALKWEFGTWAKQEQQKEIDGHILDLVKQMGANITADDESRGVRVTECRLVAGDEVFVTGRIGYKEGIKTISMDEDNVLLISDQSEQIYLNKLYGGVFYKFLIVIFFGLFLYGWIFFL